MFVNDFSWTLELINCIFIKELFYFSDNHSRIYTVMVISFRTDRSGQTVQTQIRLLLEKQSDQGL